VHILAKHGRKAVARRRGKLMAVKKVLLADRRAL